MLQGKRSFGIALSPPRRIASRISRIELWLWPTNTGSRYTRSAEALGKELKKDIEQKVMPELLHVARTLRRDDPEERCSPDPSYPAARLWSTSSPSKSLC